MVILLILITNIYNDLDDKVSNGSNPYFWGLTIGDGNSDIPLIYTENDNINFRFSYDGTSNDIRYTSMKYIYSSINDLITETDKSFKIRSSSWWSHVDSTYTDVNNIKVNGCGNTIGGSYTNLPLDDDGWGTLYCFANGTNILQFYFGWNAGHLYYRMLHDDYGWEDWIDINGIASNAQTALDKVNNLESKFNNLFTQNGNTLTINY